MKELNRRLLESKNSKLFVENMLKNEIGIMKLLDHPHLIKLTEALEDERSGKVYLVMEYCTKGPLMSEEFWKVQDEYENKVLGETAYQDRAMNYVQARRYFIQIVEGLNYRRPRLISPQRS